MPLPWVRFQSVLGVCAVSSARSVEVYPSQRIGRKPQKIMGFRPYPDFLFGCARDPLLRIERRFRPEAAGNRKRIGVDRMRKVAYPGDPLLCDAQKNGQTTLNLHHCIRIDAPEGLPDLVALHGHRLIDHHL